MIFSDDLARPEGPVLLPDGSWVVCEMTLEKLPGRQLRLGKQHGGVHDDEGSADLATGPDVLCGETATNDLQPSRTDHSVITPTGVPEPGLRPRGQVPGRLCSEACRAAYKRSKAAIRT